jgi:hypothetical protein
MRNWLTGAAMAAILLAGRLGWNLIGAEPLPEPPAADPASEAAEVDSWVREALASGDSAPALSWLSERGNVLFEGNPQEVQTLIDALYEAGAVNVWFTGIERIGSNNVSASIAVELPAALEARARVFAVEAEFIGQAEYEPTADVGQHYLEIAFD